MSKKYKIKIADTEEIDFFKVKVKIILKELAEYKNNPNIESCFVSDLSCIGDFFRKDQETDYLNFIELLENKYEIKINSTDYLIDVVKKLN